MMRQIIILLFLFNVTTLRAQVPTVPFSPAWRLFKYFFIEEDIPKVIEEVPNTGEPPTLECTAIEEEEPPPPPPKADYPLPVNQYEFNKRCENFIKPDGSIGPWGTHIENYILESDQETKDLFFSQAMPGMDGSEPYTCRNWGNMTEEQKTHFWVWTFASIAQIESSCKKDAVNKSSAVPNQYDYPRGLLQLNTLKKNRSWRGANCKFSSEIADVIKPENQIMCGLDIMRELLLGKKGEYKSNGKIFPTNSYWEKLRPNHSKTGGPIGKLVRKYPGCKL